MERQLSTVPNKSSSCCAPGCCDDSAATAAGGSESVHERVRKGYAAIASAGSWSARPAIASGGCCGPTTASAEQIATAVGYADGDLEALPEGANMGLSCGNPVALASLSPGESVLDLGSGGGLDCFIAGRRVSPHGRVIGVDMTPDMIELSRRGITAYEQATGLRNVEFRLGEIEHLPVEDASVDVVISNCVLNLSPNKPQVWREIARVLRPGGRVAISDLALLRPLPDEIIADVEALVGCVAGAVLIDETARMATEAGLTNVELITKPEYVDAMQSWQDPLYNKILDQLPTGSKASDFITSLEVRASRA